MRMMDKIWALASLLLVILSLGVATTNPGLVARITQKGLDYANYHGMVILQKELSNMKLQDFNGDYKVGIFGKVDYSFYSLINKEIYLGDFYLGLLPGEGVKASISNSAILIRGHWKLKKLFITLRGTFDLNIRHISISVSLRLGSDHSGKPMVTIDHCRSHVDHVGINIYGDLSWLLNLFQDKIESRLRSALDEKICTLTRSSVASYLQPYLQTLQVTVKVDEISSLDYSLLGPPHITWQNLDVMFKGEFFSNIHRSPIPFDAPALNLPQENSHMIYFGISDYLFNTGIMVYQESGLMNFSITDDMILTDFGIHLSTKLFKNLIPRLATDYPNMQMEFQVFPAAFPILIFSPGNMTIILKIHVEFFVILPGDLLKSVFWLSVTTNVSATVRLTSDRISGCIHSKIRLSVELTHSEIGQFDVMRIEKILNFLTATLLIPTINEKFHTGFPLPLPKDIYFYDLVLQPYKNFLLLGVNMQ